MILLHLLKWQAQPEPARRELAQEPAHPAPADQRAAQESPSLRPQVPGLVLDAYPDAVKDAVDETGLPAGRFPQDCPYAADDVLAESYLPDAAI